MPSKVVHYLVPPNRRAKRQLLRLLDARFGRLGYEVVQDIKTKDGYRLGFVLRPRASSWRLGVRSAGARALNFGLLLIPRAHRDEIAGDFVEMIASAKKYGFGHGARKVMIALKIFGYLLLFIWIGIKMRADLLSLFPAQTRE